MASGGTVWKRWLVATAVWLMGQVCVLQGQATETETGYSRMDLLDRQRLITANDRIRYQVLEEQSPMVVFTPNDRGMVRFPPLMEPVTVVGKTCYDLAIELKTLLEVDFFYRATVVIDLAESSFREHFTVFGQVRNQGRQMMPIDGIVTITQALSMAGGAIEGADLVNVTVVRRDLENPENEDRIKVNVDEVVNLGRVDKDMRLMASDVVIVGRREEMGGRYSVIGAVNNPGLFTIKQERLTVSDAILIAGGFSGVARETRVKLTRQVPDSEEIETFYINVRRVLQDGIRTEDMLVLPDDIIHVSERIIVF
jgi:protein involved in polysaccharide export with SLBB domain